MNNRITITVAGVVVLIAAATMWALTINSSYQPKTRQDLTNGGAKVACLQSQATDMVQSQQLKSQMDNAVVAAITDVPAGTKVDVHYKSHDASSATGTAIYPNDYGKYNFRITKSGESDQYTGGWEVTEFVYCK